MTGRDVRAPRPLRVNRHRANRYHRLGPAPSGLPVRPGQAVVSRRFTRDQILDAVVLRAWFSATVNALPLRMGGAIDAEIRDNLPGDPVVVIYGRR